MCVIAHCGGVCEMVLKLLYRTYSDSMLCWCTSGECVVIVVNDFQGNDAECSNSSDTMLYHGAGCCALSDPKRHETPFLISPLLPLFRLDRGASPV